MTSNRARITEAKEMYTTLTAVKGINYASIIRYNVSLLHVVKAGRDKVAAGEMTSMLAELASVYGIDMSTDEYKKDLSSFTNRLGVT